MTNKDELLKMLQDQYSLEEQAKNLYDQYLKEDLALEEAKVISEIRDDEIRHMAIVKEMMEIINNEN